MTLRTLATVRHHGMELTDYEFSVPLDHDMPSGEQLAISTTSPGQSAGNMLSPRTRRREQPLARNDSATKAEPSALQLERIVSGSVRKFFSSGDMCLGWD